MMYKTHKIFLALLLTCAGLHASSMPTTDLMSKDSEPKNNFSISTGEDFSLTFEGDDPNDPVIVRNAHTAYNCWIRRIKYLGYNRFQSFATWGAPVTHVFMNAKCNDNDTYKMKITIKATYSGDAAQGTYERAYFDGFEGKVPTKEEYAKKCGEAIGYFLESINNKKLVSALVNALQRQTTAYFMFANLITCMNKIMEQKFTDEIKRGLLTGMKEHAIGYLEYYGYRSSGLSSTQSDKLNEIVGTDKMEAANRYGSFQSAMGETDFNNCATFIIDVDNQIKLLDHQIQNATTKPPLTRQLSVGTLNDSRIGTGK